MNKWVCMRREESSLSLAPATRLHVGKGEVRMCWADSSLFVSIRGCQTASK